MDSLFSKPAIEREVVPSPRLFLDVVQRQWTYPRSSPFPTSQDKRLYNISPDLARALEVPIVDAPVAALSASSVMTGSPEEALRPEDKRMEQTLVKGHQAATWVVKASTAASSFNRASLLIWGFPIDPPG